MKKTYYILKSGELKRNDNSILMKTKEGSIPIPIENIDTIYIMNEVSFNSNFINFISQKGIIINFFNYYGYYSGSYYPKNQLNSGILLVKQVEHFIDNTKRIKIAKKILNAASYNIYRNLRYYNQRNVELKKEIKKISYLRENIDLQNNREGLMGLEGNIREIYYSCFEKIIKQEVQFKKRKKNPPDNMVNTLISFINTLIYTAVLSEIYHTQLSPLISYLHEPGVRRFSLSLDIAEIFKPLIGDRLIFSLLNKKQITENDFKKELNFLYLKENSRKIILKEFDERLKVKIKHKQLLKNVSYRYLIRLELYKLIKHFLDEKEYDGFKIWW